MTTKENIQRILALPTKFFVDVGASNAPNESQTEILLDNGWSGIMFECNPEKYIGLTNRMSGKPVIVLTEKVTPDWTRTAYSDTERNGWAVFERATSFTPYST